MDSKHHCNGCPHWYVTHKKYPSGFYNITICGKYNKQLYYMAGEENQTPHPCNICAEQFSYIPYIEQILDGVEQVTERLSANCPCNKCGKDKKCVLAKEACEDFLKWEDNCIKKLAEYETAEEEGRLVVLPSNQVYAARKDFKLVYKRRTRVFKEGKKSKKCYRTYHRKQSRYDADGREDER